MTLAPIRQLDLTIHGKEASVSTGLLAEAAITNDKVAEGAIDDAKIAAEAAIAYSKLSLAGTILNSDINADAAIAYSKLALGSSIVDSDIKSDADIAWSKLSKTGSSLADLATRSAADLSSGTLNDARLSSNVPLKDAGSNAFTGNMTVAGTLGVTGALSGSSISLTGNLGAVNGTFSGDVAAVDATLTGNLGAVNATLSGDLGAVDVTASGILSGNSLVVTENAGVGGNLTVTGNLVVNGTTTTVASTEVTIADRILRLNHSDAENAPLPAALAGFQVDRGSVDSVERAAAALTWDEIAGSWQFALLTSEETVGNLQNVKMADLQAADIDGVNLTLTGDIDAVNASFSGTLEADSFEGDGALLTNLDADNIASGELADARLSANVMLLDNNQTVTGVKTFNSSVTSVMASATDLSLKARVTGDTQDRVVLQADGKIVLGSGSAAGDVNLYRDAADVLKTDDKLVVGGALDVAGAVDFDSSLDVAGAATLGSTLAVVGNFSVATDKFTVAAASGNTVIAGTLDVDGAVDLGNILDVAGAVDFASTLNVDGAVDFGSTLDVVGAVTAASFAGDGSALTDLDADEITSGELADARLSANVMLLDNNQTVTGVKTFTSSVTSVMASASDASLKARVTGDTQDRLVLQADGQILIGSGSAAADVNLYRDAANVLKTDDKLIVGGEFNAIGNADLDGTLNVDGAVTLMSTANVAGNFSVATDKFTVAAASGNTLIAGTLEVDGAAQLDGSVAVAGNFAIASTKFTVASATGNFTSAGDGSVSGNLVVGGNLSVNGTVTYVNSTNIAVADKIIQLNRPETLGENVAVPSGYAGVSIARGTVSNVARESAAMVWDEALNRFKMGSLSVDEVTLTVGDLEVEALIAGELYGDGANITGLMADQVGIEAIEGLVADDVQEALEEIQAAIDSIMGGGSTSLSTLDDKIANLIDGLGFDEDTAVLDAFAGTTFIDDMTVRAALVKLDEEVNDAQVDLGNHIGDTVDAHDASAISVVPTGNLAADDVQEALEELQGDIDTINAKAWRQVILYSATGGETSLNKNSSDPAIPAGVNTQVFIDGRKVFEGSSRQYTVASGGGSISFAALEEGQSVEILYWA
jgi:hypothetical protein